jgi:segregation and condensation protein A
MPLEPIPVVTDERRATAPDSPFEIRLPVFEGPLQLLLHLIESRQLDVLTVPLADLADAYVEHLARHPVDAAHLSEFVATAAQLILLKSRRLLPTEPMPAAPAAEEELDEDELRRRIVEYRSLRDAARLLGERDGSAPALPREPRESDLPPAPVKPLPATRLSEALERLAAIPEPEAPPPEILAREVTIGQQIAALLEAMSHGGATVLQAVLATCRSRTEAAVTVMALLELVRRRQVRAQQRTLFGPILIEPISETGA